MRVLSGKRSFSFAYGSWVLGLVVRLFPYLYLTGGKHPLSIINKNNIKKKTGGNSIGVNNYNTNMRANCNCVQYFHTVYSHYYSPNIYNLNIAHATTTTTKQARTHYKNKGSTHMAKKMSPGLERSIARFTPRVELIASRTLFI